MTKTFKTLIFALAFAFTLGLTGCATAPPADLNPIDLVTFVIKNGPQPAENACGGKSAVSLEREINIPPAADEPRKGRVDVKIVWNMDCKTLAEDPDDVPVKPEAKPADEPTSRLSSPQ